MVPGSIPLHAASVLVSAWLKNILACFSSMHSSSSSRFHDRLERARQLTLHMGHEARYALTCIHAQVNEFVKRVRAAKIHILIMGHLRKQMPAMMGKQKAQEKLLRNLPEHFSFVQREYHLPVGAFHAPIPASKP